MKHLWVAALSVALVVGAPSLPAQQAMVEEKVPVRVYPVDKRVADLPAEEDFSKPERAYAAIHRRLVMGDSDWKAMSVERLGPVLPKPPTRPTPLGERAARGYLEARIVEVRMIADNIAYVITQWPASGSYDVRCMEIEAGRWLNAGNQQANTLDAARKVADDMTDPRRQSALTRQRQLYPEDHLNRFVDFLKRSSSEPKDFVIRNLANHRLVMLGQIPHRPVYTQFLSEVIRDPRFANSVGVIFMQLPANLQTQADAFFALESPEASAAIPLLREIGWMGLPDQDVLELFMTIAATNRGLSKEAKIRVVFVDQQWPWDRLKNADDLRAYDVSRDAYMAHNVLRHFVMNPGEARNGLFVLDINQAARNLRWRADDTPIRTAGWRISQVLGEQCFAIMPHSPQISERGSVSGRAARGLFDSALQTIDFKPVAFSLPNSPFGTELFDASADLDSSGFYQDGFDGYIALARLEDERFAALIDGFFTDDFVREVDRRHKIVFGRTLAEEIGFDDIDTERFLRWISRTWNRPRAWKDHLGSTDAWRTGAEEGMQ